MRYSHLLNALFASAISLFASVAAAQSSGDIAIRVGATSVHPNASNSRVTPEIAPGSGLDIKNANQVSAGFTYFFDTNWALDVPIAPAFHHDLVGTGTLAPAGKLGQVSNVPLQVLGQYRFGQADDLFRPFVGVGATYVVVTSARTAGPLTPLTLDLDNSAGLALQAGLSFSINKTFSIEASVVKSAMTAKGKLSSGQTLSIQIRPMVSSLSLVYRL